jgi:hypothetical protein
MAGRRGRGNSVTGQTLTALQHQLTLAAQGPHHGVLQQRQAALHHGHPIAGHPHHGALVV